jgi:prepilin-type N-terminal cleavage/methylation domain-containing protein
VNASRQQWPPGRRAANGFSLIELMVVSIIIVVLIVLVSTQLGTSSRDRALADCRKNLQKIYLTLSIYENDNNGAFPFLKGASNSAGPLSLLVPKSTTVTGMFICPGSGDPPLPEAESFASRKISYAYYMGLTTNDDPGQIIVSDAQVDAAPKNQGQQIFSADGRKPGNNHGKQGGNLLSRGGDVAGCEPKASRDVRYPPSVRMLNPE